MGEDNSSGDSLASATHNDTGANSNTQLREGKEKRKFSLVTTILASLATAFVGFISGIAVNLANSYPSSAHSCFDALTHYASGLSQLPLLAPVLSSPTATFQQQTDSMNQANDRFSAPHSEVVNNCDPGYLQGRDFDAWNSNYQDIASKCYVQRACAVDQSEGLSKTGLDLTYPLMDQAVAVSRWGILHRAFYALKHPF